MKKKSILYLLLGAVLISGCGSKKQDMDYQKDLQDNKIETSTVNDVSKSGSEDNEDTTGVIDASGSADVSYVIEGNNTITVNADIARKGNVKFAQAMASTKVYTEEDIKQIADNFFDNSIYITLLHPSQGTGAYVKERTTKLDEYEHSLIGEDGLVPNWITDEKERLEFYSQGESETKYNLEEDIKLYQMTDDNIDGLAGLSYCLLEGMHDGAMYRMSFYNNGDKSYMDCYRLVAYYERQPVVIYDEERIKSIDSVTNKNELVDKELDEVFNSEKAKEMACKMIAELGLDGYNVTDVFGTLVLNSYGLPGYDESEMEIGYKVYFAKDIQGNERAYDFKNGYTANDSVYGFVTVTPEDYEGFITNEEYLTVVVTPSGIDSVVNINQMEIDEIVNSDVEIMSFEEIDKIAQEKMNSKELDTGYNQDIEVSEIKLALAQVEKDGSYDIVPAWYYMFELPDKEFPIKKCLICINAIDGSVIR